MPKVCPISWQARRTQLHEFKFGQTRRYFAQILGKQFEKIAISKNGKEWSRLNKAAIDFKNNKENALARPCVMQIDDKYFMWFSKKGKN